MRSLRLAWLSAAVCAVPLLASACGDDAVTASTGPTDAGAVGDETGAPTDGEASTATDGDASTATDGDASTVTDAHDGAPLDAQDGAPSDVAEATTDAAPTCTPATIDYAASAAERDAVAAAVAAFETVNPGVSVKLTGATQSAHEIDGDVPVTLDSTIADPCDRALAALQAFFTDNASWLRLPAGLKKKACSYDSLTDSEIVRLDGGTYFDGRPLVGQPTELLIHVRRNGHIKYWMADYVAVLDRPALTPCLDGAGAAAAAVGAVLDYTKFKACMYQGPGQVTLTSSDSYVPLETGVFVDASDRLHFVRLVDGFLAPSHVTPETGNSDLYCCGTPSTKDCVGKTLAIDELTGEVLGQYPRCHTC